MPRCLPFNPGALRFSENWIPPNLVILTKQPCPAQNPCCVDEILNHGTSVERTFDCFVAHIFVEAIVFLPWVTGKFLFPEVR